MPNQRTSSAIIARAQVRQVLRVVHRVIARGAMPPGLFGSLAAVVAVMAVCVGLARAWAAGAELGGTFGESLLVTAALVAGTIGGCACLVGLHLWAGQLVAERRKLVVLPLGHSGLWLHALVPIAIPTVISVGLTSAILTAVAAGMQRSPVPAFVAAAAGVALAWIIGLTAALLCYPWLARTVGRKVWAVATIAGPVALVAHAISVLADPLADLAMVRWNPVVLVMAQDEPWSGGHLLLVMALLVGVGAAILSVLKRRLAHPSNNRRPTSQARPDPQSTLRARLVGWRRRVRSPRIRVWWGLARVAATHSSIISEVLSMAVVVAAAAVLAAQLWRGGRTEHADVVLLLTAAAAGVPVLGVRASLGPMSRLAMLGVCPADLRRGLVLIALLVLGPSVLGAGVVLVVGGMPVAAVVRLGAFAVAANGVGLLLSCALRDLMALSVGRAFGSAGYAVAVAVALQSGWPAMGGPALFVATLVTVALIVAALHLTVTDRSLT